MYLVVCLFVCFKVGSFYHNSGYPEFHYVDQAGFKLRNTPASASIAWPQIYMLVIFEGRALGGN